LLIRLVAEMVHCQASPEVEETVILQVLGLQPTERRPLAKAAAILHWLARSQLIASELRGTTMVVTARDSSSTAPTSLPASASASPKLQPAADDRSKPAFGPPCTVGMAWSPKPLNGHSPPAAAYAWASSQAAIASTTALSMPQ
jgi:hypothetical protein